MKVAIVYCSEHQQNTKKLVEAIATEHKVKLIDVNSTKSYNLNRFDLIGFASGIYYSKFSDKIIDFAKENLPMFKRVFLLYTCGSMRDYYTKAITAVVDDKICDVVGSYGCNGFGSFGFISWFGGISRGRPNEQDIKGAVEFYESLTSPQTENSEK